VRTLLLPCIVAIILMTARMAAAASGNDAGAAVKPAAAAEEETDSVARTGQADDVGLLAKKSSKKAKKDKDDDEGDEDDDDDDDDKKKPKKPKKKPFSVDDDGDGMSDEVEKKWFTNTAKSNGRGDSDGDGMTDMEEYVAGTDPTDSGSRFTVTGCDLPEAGSGDVELRWPASAEYPDDAPERVYTILAADNDAGLAKAPLATIIDKKTGQESSWTDADVLNRVSSRFYTISVSFGGRTVTNREEWAVCTSSRKSNTKYLVAVPVDLGDENTLDGALGIQLARGLCPGNSTDEADSILFLSEDNQWKECFLRQTGRGRLQWWDPDVGRRRVTTRIPAGTAIWVVCGKGARPADAKAVFTGKTFNTQPPIHIRTGNEGWNTFGWVCSRPLAHRNTERQKKYSTPANQLGLANIGVGGLTADPRRKSETGDQIWVWKDNTWKHFYWLVGGNYPNWSGKWWDSHTGTFADFELEPGMGYYYRHSSNFGGTNFTWHPNM